MRADRRHSEDRFVQLLREFRQEFRQDGARRDAAFQKALLGVQQALGGVQQALGGVQQALGGVQQAFKDVRSVGLSIVKTLNHHTRLLERIDRKLGAPRHNGPHP